MLLVESFSLPLHSGAAPAHPLGAALGSVLASGQHLQVSIMVSATQASPPFVALKAVFLVRCLWPAPCWPQVATEVVEVLVQLLPAIIPVQGVHVVQAQSTNIIQKKLTSEA